MTEPTSFEDIQESLCDVCGVINCVEKNDLIKFIHVHNYKYATMCSNGKLVEFIHPYYEEEYYE